MAQHGTATSKVPARRSAAAGILAVFGLLLTVLVATALPLCVLLLTGMVPSVVAALVDRDTRRYLTAAVTITNLAGLVLPGLALLKLGMSLTSAQAVLIDPRNWLIMYGAAGIGWVVNAAMLALARIVLGVRDDREGRRLASEAARLVEEWGPEVDAA